MCLNFFSMYNVYHFSGSMASPSNGLHANDSTESNQHQREMKRARDVLERKEKSGETVIVPERSQPRAASDPHRVLTEQMRGTFRWASPSGSSTTRYTLMMFKELIS